MLGISEKSKSVGQKAEFKSLSKIAQKIVFYIQNNPGTSYVEIEDIFERNNFDYEGDLSIVEKDYQNIIHWSGWNENALSIMSEIESTQLLKRNISTRFIYAVDGKTLELQIAKRMYDYKTPRWLPIEFIINEDVL